MKLTRRTLLATTLATTVAHAEAAVLRIGQIVPMSGVFKSISEPSAVAADLAVADINAAGGVGGLKLELVRYDTASDPAQAAVAARKLIEDDGVLAIIGPFASSEASVAANNAERAHVAMLPSAASRPGLADGHKYLWPLATDERLSFSRVLTALDRRGEKPKSARILYVADEVVASDAGNKTYPAVFTAVGVPFGTPVAVLYKAFDFSPQVAKVLQDAPDVIAVAGNPDMASKVLGELRRQGFKGRMIGSTLFSDPNNIELFGAGGDGTVFASLFWKQSSPAAARFDADLVAEAAKRGIRKLGVNYPDAITYDSVGVLAQAMRAAAVTGEASRRDAEREAINAALPGVHIDGVLGAGIRFQGQYGQLPGYVLEISGGDRRLFAAFPPGAG